MKNRKSSSLPLKEIIEVSHYGKQWIGKLGLVLSYIIAMLPFIAVIHNLNVMA